MNLHMEQLTPQKCNDFLYYFDNVAFTDHEEFSACYCLESHLIKEEDETYDTKDKRREKAKQMILQGIMKGYLIYDDADVIGWCNADWKINYKPIMEHPDFHTPSSENDKTIIMYCMEIAPGYRGKGIAHFILDEVCKEAKEKGARFVECYPFADEAFAYQYRGPFKLYQKHGFEVVEKRSWCYVMRKAVN